MNILIQPCNRNIDRLFVLSDFDKEHERQQLRPISIHDTPLLVGEVCKPNCKFGLNFLYKRKLKQKQES